MPHAKARGGKPVKGKDEQGTGGAPPPMRAPGAPPIRQVPRPAGGLAAALGRAPTPAPAQGAFTKLSSAGRRREV